MTLTEIGNRAMLAGYNPECSPFPGQMAMTHPRGLVILVTIAPQLDGKEWVHLSLSRSKQLPTWEDIVFVKETVLGRESKAVQVIPPASEHVNIHPFVHHLFCCNDEDPLPDFTQGSGSL